MQDKDVKKIPCESIDKGIHLQTEASKKDNI